MSKEAGETASNEGATEVKETTANEPVMFDDMGEDSFYDDDAEDEGGEDPAEEKEDEEEEPEKKSSTEEKEEGEEEGEDAGKAAKDPEKKDESGEKTGEAAKKVLKAKDGDKEIEIPLEGKVTVAVDGKDEEVTIQELRDNYAGKVSYDKKFTELSIDRKAFEREKFRADQTLNDLLETSKKDAFSLIGKIAQHHGEDPFDYVKSFREQLMKAAKDYWSGSDEDRQNLDLQFERDYYKNQANNSSKSADEQAQHRELATQIADIEKTHGIKEDELHAAFKDLKKLQVAGKLKRDIDLNLVVDVILQERQFDTVSGVLKEVDPQLEKDQKAIELLTDAYKLDPKLSRDELKEIAEGLFKEEDAAKEEKEALRRKVEKNDPGALKKSKDGGEKKKPITFDDLDDDYEI